MSIVEKKFTETIINRFRTSDSSLSNSISPREYFANLAKYTEEANTIKQNDHRQCLVCGDRSNGKHYGILACNGCSGFFKRTVRRKLIYHCQVNSKMCFIDKIHRNQCQACRYKKCLQMGMIKEAVQNQRPSKQTENTLTICCRFEQTNDDTIASKILLMLIEWIRHLPIFYHLSIHDQRILLEETWSELFLLSAMMEKNFFVDHEERLKNIWLNFQNFQIDSIEFICLKTILLFRFDIRTLNENQIIEHFQDQAQMTLAKYHQRYHHPTRFGRLLLSLSSFRVLSPQWVEKTYFSSRSISKFLVDMLIETKK